MRNTTVLACVLASGALTGLASADTVSVVFEGTTGNLGSTVTVSLGGGLFFQDGGSSHGVWAGQYSHKIDGVSTKTYCTELTQWAGSGEFEVVSLDQAPVPGSGMGQAKAEAIYKLFNATNRAADIDTNAKAAAFQAVLWEIVYDFNGQESDVGMNTGNVRFSGGVNGTLFDLYRAYAADGNGDKSPSVSAIVNETRQDQMRIVPLPGAAAMAGLGLAGISARRRRT